MHAFEIVCVCVCVCVCVSNGGYSDCEMVCQAEQQSISVHDILALSHTKFTPISKSGGAEAHKAPHHPMCALELT